MKGLCTLAVAMAVATAIGSAGPGASGVLEARRAQREERPFALGVLRRDGLVIPFAVFDERWKSPWPAGMPSEMPISLTDVPRRWWGVDEPFERFALWRDGKRAGEVTIAAPTVTRPMCQPRVVLRSDYKATSVIPPVSERPHPKDGLLVGGGVSVGRIDPVERGAEWNSALAAMTPEFNRLETIAAGGFAAWRHPFRADDRRLTPITIESLYRAEGETPGWTPYFVEAVRQYPPSMMDRGCGPLTYVHGWILLGPDDRSWVRLSARIAYCDRFGVRYMLPLGTIKAKNRVYWVFQFAGAESEWYEVARPLPGRIESHVSFSAGACGPSG